MLQLCPRRCCSAGRRVGHPAQCRPHLRLVLSPSRCTCLGTMLAPLPNLTLCVMGGTNLPPPPTGVIRDPAGPREDSGFSSAVNPGLLVTQRLYNYCQRYHPKTRVMAAGLRNKQGTCTPPKLCSSPLNRLCCTDALALAGCDYLVVSPKVLLSLSTTATLQGYNDGLTAGPDSDGPALSAERAKVRLGLYFLWLLSDTCPHAVGGGVYPLGA